LPKTPETVQLIYGILAAGAAYVPLPYREAPARLGRILTAIRPALFITTGAMARLLQAAGETLPQGTRLIETSEQEEALAALYQGIPPSRTIAEVSPGDLATIFFTSGSTSEPKGVMWSQRSMAASVGDTIRRRGATAADRFISVAMLHYSASCEIFYPIMAGASFYLANEREGFLPDHLAEVLERNAITVWGSTSTALRLLAEGGNLPRRKLHALRFVEFFGERMPLPALREAMAAMPHAQFCCIYGATEAFNIAEYRLPRPLASDWDTLPLGLPWEGYEFSLRDEEGAPVPRGEIGEICVAGPGVTIGYWNETPANAVRRLAGVADSFRTGDRARWGDDGLLRLLGREDQMIKIRGHRFELGEVEAAARAEPRVKEAVAFPIGSPAEATGVVLAVLSEADDSERADIADAIRRVSRQRLPRFANPQRVVICREFPLLSSGKTDRRALQALVAPDATS
ncbi:MAG TPA: AMP-binding protein, partial [Dongiaceae bacterium]|nr:AMP-binding protein [Dongiaceae bacterium]